jgi:hypothetical protein
VPDVQRRLLFGRRSILFRHLAGLWVLSHRARHSVHLALFSRLLVLLQIVTLIQHAILVRGPAQLFLPPTTIGARVRPEGEEKAGNLSCRPRCAYCAPGEWTHSARDEEAIESAGEPRRSGCSQPTHPCAERAGEAAQLGQQAVHLGAAVLTVHTPLAKVLTVVAQQAVATFSKPGARTLNDLFASQGIGSCRSYPHRMSMSEA